MPRIPGVPTLEPVKQPMMSPGEAGRVGGAIAQMGDVGQDVSELEWRIRAAQEHVDTLAARNQMDAAYANIQDELAKTQNSRDVPGIIEQGNKTLNDLSAQWSKSPAAVAIQMDADSLRPSLSRVGTVRQVDLMGKELKITLDHQAEVLAGDYASDRASGGTGDTALGVFATAVQGGVTTGLLGDVEAQEYVRLFRQRGQELQIKNGITNANPEVNQKTYDDISQNRDRFPDVTQEQLDIFKGQAQAAFEEHTKHQEWAEGQMAQNTMLRPLIDLHTNPATGQFDVEGARADVAQQFKDGKLTVTQEGVLEKGLQAYQSDVSGAIDKQADEFEDSILKSFHDHNYSEAYAALERQRPWLEQNGLSDKYKSLLNYGDQQRREERVEARANYTLEREGAVFAKQQREEASSDTLYAVLADMASGKIYTDDQIRMLSGEGSGKMLTSDVDKAIVASHSYQKDQNYGAAVDLMMHSFVVPEHADAKEISRAHAMYARTFSAWQQRVNENPTEDKVQAAREVMEPAIQQQIADQVNRIFGVPPQKDSGFGFRVGAGRFVFGKGYIPDKPESVPKEGDTATPRVGDIRPGNDGNYRFKGGDQYDRNNWEKVK